MFSKSEGISENLVMAELAAPMKPTAEVIAIESKPKGSIFAKSFDKSSLMNEVILTAATKAAEIIKTVAVDIPWDKIKVKTARTANQKKVTIGSKTKYSIM